MGSDMARTALAEIDISDVEEVASRIKYVLGIYPGISISMLQVGIGTSTQPALWKPILEQLISSGDIVRDVVFGTIPTTGRSYSYTKLSLVQVREGLTTVDDK